jgi:succinate dehydrogenase cytochrome b subunit
LLRRLHSLTGVVPLGAFLVVHLWANAGVLAGERAYDRTAGSLQRLPLWPVVEVLFILLPLAFHGIYGVWLATRGARPAPEKKALTLLQRASGVVVLVFVVGHVAEFRVQKWFFGMSADAFPTALVDHLSWTWGGVPWIAFAYLAGIAASIFHLANGIASLATKSRFANGATTERRVVVMAAVLGSVLFVVSAATVIALATGTRLLSPADEGKTAPCGSALPAAASP